MDSHQPSQEGLAKIEGLTKGYADTRNRLAREVRELTERLESTKNARLPGIKTALASVKEAEFKLQNAIEEMPTLFEKPRSVIFHGIKVGFQKSKGGISWEDEAQVLKLIRRHLNERFDELVKVTEKPLKGALNGLSTADLKRIGCVVLETGDLVLIKPVDSDVDKLVAALLKESPEDGEGDE